MTIDSTKREALQTRHDLEARHAAEKAQLEHRLLQDYVLRADHQLQAEQSAQQIQQIRIEMSSKAKENAEKWSKFAKDQEAHYVTKIKHMEETIRKIMKSSSRPKQRRTTQRLHEPQRLYERR